MRRHIFLILIGFGLFATPLSAQLGLPQVQLPRTGTVLDPVTGNVLGQLDDLEGMALRQAQRLATLRERRLNRLVRRNRDVLELDARGEPARRGVLLLIDASVAQVATARSLGFASMENYRIEGLELEVVELAPPDGIELDEAERLLANALPNAAISADNLHFQSGEATSVPLLAAASIGPGSVPIGVIDGAPSSRITVAAKRGFAKGAPYPSNHGSAVVSLLEFAGASDVRVADVYGTDPAGGNALAIAKAIGWLVEGGSKVVNISLVGPRNALVERAISAAHKRGVVVVAAVGNDGPAAPPSYPASYDGVVAVTAVDKRNRALIEAGRALHLDYAAPGADIYAPNARGKRVRLRGTSFASPLVAARLAAAIERGGNWRDRLDSEARDLGRRGPDATYGRGLICDPCRPGK